jgi:hypothetical protein
MAADLPSGAYTVPALTVPTARRASIGEMPDAAFGRSGMTGAARGRLAAVGACLARDR